MKDVVVMYVRLRDLRDFLILRDLRDFLTLRERLPKEKVGDKS